MLGDADPAGIQGRFTPSSLRCQGGQTTHTNEKVFFPVVFRPYGNAWCQVDGSAGADTI
jgi:hypothetical protein